MKKQKNYSLSTYNFMVAYNVFFKMNGIESIHENHITMLPSQEKFLIEKDSFEKLSSEAKEVVQTILNAPTEVLETMMTSKYKMVSKKLVQKYFKNKGWKKPKLDRVFMELAEYTRGL